MVGVDSAEQVSGKVGAERNADLAGMADFLWISQVEDAVALAAEVVGGEGFGLSFGMDGIPTTGWRSGGGHEARSPNSAPPCRLRAKGNHVKALLR